MNRATLFRIPRLYLGASWRERLHMTVRVLLCPLERLAPFVPPAGLIVDLGCGHGLFTHALAMEEPQRRLVGVEPDGAKLTVARTSVTPGGRVRFVRGDALHNPVAGPCRAVLIVDVAYLLTAEEQEQVLRDSFARLGPGGVLLLKTVDVRPRWKIALNRLEEWLAVRLLRITLGPARPFTFRPLEEWAELFRRIGFETQTVRLDRGYYHPHVAVIGVRPSKTDG